MTFGLQKDEENGAEEMSALSTGKAENEKATAKTGTSDCCDDAREKTTAWQRNCSNVLASASSPKGVPLNVPCNYQMKEQLEVYLINTSPPEKP